MPIVLFGYFCLGRFGFRQAAVIFVFLSSLWFYSFWNIYYLPILLLSVVVNFCFGRALERNRNKVLLAFAIFLNLGVLAYFKYFVFFMISIRDFAGISLAVPEITLPLGISFFTFTQVAYLVDAYKSKTDKTQLTIYSLFVTYFPHLIAGPILYHKHIIPQFLRKENYYPHFPNLQLGFILFIFGLFKKVIIADSLSAWTTAAYANAHNLTMVQAWAGALSYTLQIYFDFSGYSEMAIGLALMMNIHLPINFNSPYQANSIIAFWRRWHITLSSFLKNYLYIPLGGSRCGLSRKISNLMLTMLLGGLWHGAGWTFIFWGGLHGVFLTINHLWRRIGIALPVFLSRAATFLAVVYAWVFFRSPTLADAVSFSQTMLGFKGLPGHWSEIQAMPGGYKQAFVLAFLLLVVQLMPDTLKIMNYDERKESKGPNDSGAVGNPADRLKEVGFGITIGIIAGILAFVCLKQMAGGEPSEFLYFQF
ncbi:MAG TPA: MBOAT family O-acyltransferase [Methylomusa anaerophila]|nr:MBOAT family O-acyltransferase [Methylomusa anaerophila]HML89436.1 MBOAT family O-acyltransferase [Methylomusa anaerophila]